MMNQDQKEIVYAAIRQAGDVLLRYWPGRDTPKEPGNRTLEITKKPDGSAVTNADLESNQIILAALEHAFPGVRIFSEESDDNTDGGTGPVWIVDPLDGTQTFIEGRDDFSILAALCEGGVVQNAVMYFPAKALFVEAGKGKGVFIDSCKLQVSSADRPRRSSIYIRNFNPPASPVHYPTWMDSGMALMSVARGEFDGAILKIINHKEWDLASATLAISEAGGQVSDEFGNQIAFLGATIKLNYFVASNGKVHQELLDMIAHSK